MFPSRPNIGETKSYCNTNRYLSNLCVRQTLLIRVAEAAQRKFNLLRQYLRVQFGNGRHLNAELRRPTLLFLFFQVLELDLAKHDFLPYLESTFTARPKMLTYYRNGISRLLEYDKFAGERLDAITAEKIAGYVTYRRYSGLMVSSINRQLQVVRRMFHLAQEGGKVEKRRLVEFGRSSVGSSRSSPQTLTCFGM
jgi:hypothetical protein